MTDADLRSKLAESESVIQQLVAKLQETVDENDRLRAVVAKLTGTDDAHSTLRRLYLDETQPVSARVRAAQAALNVEKPSLKPQPAPLDLVAEEPIEPLADLVARQRARADAMLREPRDIEVSPTGVVRVLPKPGSNGSGCSDDSSGSN
jgi:hypothetical protein